MLLLPPLLLLSLLPPQNIPATWQDHGTGMGSGWLQETPTK